MSQPCICQQMPASMPASSCANTSPRHRHHAGVQCLHVHNLQAIPMPRQPGASAASQGVDTPEAAASVAHITAAAMAALGRGLECGARQHPGHDLTNICATYKGHLSQAGNAMSATYNVLRLAKPSPLPQPAARDILGAMLRLLCGVGVSAVHANQQVGGTAAL